MSKDWTPKELDMIQRETKMPNLVDIGMVIHIGNITMPMYSKEEIDVSHKYERLGMFGFDFIKLCLKRGYLRDDKGKELIQEVEDYFKTGTIKDQELIETANKWYEGELEPGWYMERNNEAFADYIGNLLAKQKGEK